MKKCNLSVFGTLVAIGLLVAESANAAITWTGITLNTADVESWMGLVIPGLAVMWGLRKVIKVGNRS